MAYCYSFLSSSILPFPGWNDAGGSLPLSFPINSASILLWNVGLMTLFVYFIALVHSRLSPALAGMLRLGLGRLVTILIICLLCAGLRRKRSMRQDSQQHEAIDCDGTQLLAIVPFLLFLITLCVLVSFASLSCDPLTRGCLSEHADKKRKIEADEGMPPLPPTQSVLCFRFGVVLRSDLKQPSSQR